VIEGEPTMAPAMVPGESALSCPGSLALAIPQVEQLSTKLRYGACAYGCSLRCYDWLGDPSSVIIGRAVMRPRVTWETPKLGLNNSSLLPLDADFQFASHDLCLWPAPPNLNPVREGQGSLLQVSAHAGESLRFLRKNCGNRVLDV